jgi:hypothetical protein
MTSSVFAVFVILSVFGVIIAQRLAAGPKALPWNRPPMLRRFRDLEKVAAFGPLPAWLMYGIGLVAVANFIVFFLACLFLGGDALTGYQASGRYYLGSKHQMTEVSREVFQFSLWQTRSVFVTHPLAMLVWMIAWQRSQRPGQF